MLDNICRSKVDPIAAERFKEEFPAFPREKYTRKCFIAFIICNSLFFIDWKKYSTSLS